MRQVPRSPLSFKLQRVANVPEHPPPSTRLMSCAHIANRRLSRIIGASASPPSASHPSPGGISGAPRMARHGQRHDRARPRRALKVAETARTLLDGAQTKRPTHKQTGDGSMQDMDTTYRLVALGDSSNVGQTAATPQLAKLVP